MTIWAQQENYLFYPSFRKIDPVTGDHSNVDFAVSGWYDDFSKTSSGWAQDDLGNYHQGEYWLKATPSYSTRVMAPHPVPPSYTIEANVYSNDYDGGYGFVFNFTGENKGNYFHIFQVKPSGDLSSGYNPYFQLIKANIVNVTSEGLVLDYEEIIKKIDNRIEEYSNKLKVKQNWREVWLLINDDKVWVGEIDAEPVSSLDFGLYAFADGSSEYVAWFDNLQVDGVVHTQGQIGMQTSALQKAYQDIKKQK
ncbi:MAG TPA: hypothetical protein GXX33_07395 [Firmicutes bacterium]|nr:hypothetical protein [Bacillota bacterium]